MLGMDLVFWGLLVFHLILGAGLYYRLSGSKKARGRRQRTAMRARNLKDPGPISDPEALAAAEREARAAKPQIEAYGDRGYFVLRTFGSADGFSASYMHGLVDKIRAQGLRAELIEVNGSLVAMETGNFLRFQLMAHQDDAEAIQTFLDQWFSIA